MMQQMQMHLMYEATEHCRYETWSVIEMIQPMQMQMHLLYLEEATEHCRYDMMD